MCCIGTPEQIHDFRERWMTRAPGIADSLGLNYRVDQASDPFFGRGGKLMAISQIEQSLKFELLIPVRSAEEPTACMSFNYHRDHFGTTWGLSDEAGEVSHTGCVAFGIDRLALALFSAHGAELAALAGCRAQGAVDLGTRRARVAQLPAKPGRFSRAIGTKATCRSWGRARMRPGSAPWCSTARAHSRA